MFTQIGNKRSGLRTLTCGVPQGSVLGPLLFLLYGNCLPNSSKFYSLLFADDTTLLIEDSKIDTFGVADGVGGWRLQGVDPRY